MLSPAAGSDSDDWPFARFHLLDVIQVFREDGIVRCNENRGQVRPNERDDSMFELGAGMTFGKKVGDFFQLKGGFERDRVIELPPEEQHSTNTGIFLRDRLNLIAQLENLLDLSGQCVERVNDSFSLRGRELPHPTEKQTDQRQNYQLRRKRFRRGDWRMSVGFGPLPLCHYW